MKKNILTLIILVVSVANMILSAIMMFAIVPSAKKTDKMVTDICKVMDLELGAEEKEKKNKVDLKDLVFYDVSEEATVRLKDTPGDDAAHFAVVQVSISMDSKNKDYKKYGADMDSRKSLIQNAVLKVVSNYTYESAQDKTEEMKKKILEELQETFDSDFIYEVLFTDIKLT